MVEAIHANRPETTRIGLAGAAVTPGSHPGQPARDSAESVLLGLVGAGIAASRSPAMHECEGQAQGLRLAYQLLNLDAARLGAAGLSAVLNAAELLGFAGLNITHPCKQAVIPLLDELSPAARVLGAVNTVVFADGVRHGHNTDWSGFLEAFRRGLPDAQVGRVLQLGAGGAGAAVAHALLTLGAGTLMIHDIEPDRCAQLCGELVQRFGPASAIASDTLDLSAANADGVVNCTPVGMAAHPGLPLPPRLLRPAMWVADIVYFPLETELLRCARALGCRTLDGGGMAVLQAADAFALFTGRSADTERMLRQFRGGFAPDAQTGRPDHSVFAVGPGKPEVTS